MTLAPGSYFDEAVAERAVQFFSMLKHTDGKFYGQPFRLLPWQEQIIRDVYGTLKEDGSRQYKFVWVELPKKNGKSGLGSGTALYHLFADGEMNGEIYSCAAEKKQAGIIFDGALAMLRMVPALEKRAKILASTKTIIDKQTGTTYMVMSAEAYSKHGFKPSAVIFDEIHAQPNRKLWDVMTHSTGATRFQPIWWNFTTAGEDPDRVSIGWELHDYAEKVAAGDIIDPEWYVAIYSYEGDDIYNEENWFKANPSLGPVKSLDDMRGTANRAKNSKDVEKNFRWLDLNQWVTSKLSSWIPRHVYDETEKDIPDEALLGMKVYLGQDASTTTDLSSVVRLFPPQPGLDHWHVKQDSWIPRESMEERIRSDKIPYNRFAKSGHVHVTDGNTIDHFAILEKTIEYARDYVVVELVSDPAFAVMLMQAQMDAGINVVQQPSTFAIMTDPINEVERLMRNGELTHDKDPLLQWCFGNASIASNGSGLRKLVKETRGKQVIRTKRIDPVMALVLAMARARFFVSQKDINEQIKAEGWGM